MSIRDDFFAAQAKASLWDVAVSIKRGNPLPLDANAVYKTLGVATVNGETTTYTEDSLLEYAKTNPVAYPGQVCAVVEADSTTIYYLDQNLDVKPVGVIPTGDNKTIEVTADGQISLFGADEATAGQQPRIVNKGTAEAPRLELEWYTPDNSTVAGLKDTVGALKESVDGIVEEDGTVTKEGLTHKVAALEEEKLDANGWVSNDYAKGWEYHQEGRNEELYGSYNEAELYKSGIHFGRESSIDTGSTTDLNANGLRIYEYSSAGDNTELEITVDKITSKTHSSEFGSDDTSYEYNYPTQSGTLIVDKDLAPYAKTEDVNTALGNKADADDLTALEEKVDAFLTGDGTEAALDSLKELIKYIEEHDDVELADIIADVEALQTKVTLGTDAEGKEYTTVKAYVEAAIAALKIGDYAKAADLTTLAGRVSTLEAKPFDTYATKDEVNAKADASALDGYYNKDQIDSALQNYVTTGNFNDSIDQLNESISTITLTYATKKELSDHADAAALAYATKEELNAHKQTAESTYAKQGDSYLKAETYAKTEIYSKTEIDKFLDDVTGGSTESAASVKRALDAYIQNIDTELYGAETVNGWKDAEGNYTPKYASDNSRIDINKAAIEENAADIAALELAINGKPESGDTPPVLGLAGRLAAIEAEVGEVANSRIDTLAGVTAQHTTDIGANAAAIETINTKTIPALEAAIAAETKAREDADKAINEKIGTVESGKTVVDMINAVAGTIDFTPYATNARVDEIYKVDGETKSGVLADTIADVDANTAAIALLNDEATKEGSVKHTVATELAKIVADADADYDTLKEIADWITNDTTGAAKMANDIAALNTKVDTGDKTVTEYVAHYHTQNQYVLPAATVAALGGIKSAADVVDGEVTTVATNKVYVDATSSVGEVKAISTDILVNGSEELILFGGNASVTA